MSRDDPPPGLSNAPRPSTHRRARLVVVMLLAVALPVGAAILRSVPPSSSAFYPRCLFKAATGLNCPGCGATRCLHSLLNGRYAQAFAYNPVLVIVLPFLVFAAGLESYVAWTGRVLIRRRLPKWSILAIFWFLLAYWVARNIDVYPFALLAPRELALE